MPYKTPARPPPYHDDTPSEDSEAQPYYTSQYRPSYSYGNTPNRGGGQYDSSRYYSDPRRGPGDHHPTYRTYDPEGRNWDYDDKTNKDNKPLYKKHIQPNPYMSPLRENQKDY